LSKHAQGATIQGIYTQVNSKVGFWLRRTSTSLRLLASPNLFKLSCFSIASLSQICGAGFAKFPTFEFPCVYKSRRDFVSDLDLAGQLRYGNQLHILAPHPDANFWDHEFLSPTFEKAITRHVLEYTARQ
jgi:hypothetical protein